MEEKLIKLLYPDEEPENSEELADSLYEVWLKEDSDEETNLQR